MSELLDCGHTPTETSGPGTGTALRTDEDGKNWSMCYHCAYLETMDEIVMTGISLRNDQADFRLPCLYMSGDGKTITTWDGQFVGHVTSRSKIHNFSRDRRHINVRITYGADVVNAYGIGAPGEYCVLRRFKSDTVRAA